MKVLSILIAVAIVIPTILCMESGENHTNRPPQAFIRYEGILQTGKRIIFDASDSTDPDGDQLYFTWNFGDSTTLRTAKEVVYHRYQNPGRYQVILTVSDGMYTDSTSVELVIEESPNKRPVAVARDVGMVFLGDDGTVTVRFDASESYDPDGDQIWCLWDFNDTVDRNGDGIGYNDCEANGTVVDHTFNSTGDYNVTLTVTDGELNDTARIVVMVRWPTPRADLENENRGALGFEIWIHNVTREVDIGDVNYWIIRNGEVIVSGNCEDTTDDVIYRDDDLDGNFSSEDNIIVEADSGAQSGDEFRLTYRKNEIEDESYGGEMAKIASTILKS